jgi:hypothetical protein
LQKHRASQEGPLQSFRFHLLEDLTLHLLHLLHEFHTQLTILHGIKLLEFFLGLHWSNHGDAIAFTEKVFNQSSDPVLLLNRIRQSILEL